VLVCIFVLFDFVKCMCFLVGLDINRKVKEKKKFDCLSLECCSLSLKKTINR